MLLPINFKKDPKKKEKEKEEKEALLNLEQY